MTTTQPELNLDDRRRQEAGLLEAVVGENVLGALGRPAGSYRLQVRCVWGDRYRANVYVPDGTGAFRVAHSFFLIADENGKILSSSPALLRAY